MLHIPIVKPKKQNFNICRHFRTPRCELKYPRESDDVVAGPQSQAHLFMGSTFQTLTPRTYEAQPNFTAPFCANVWLRKRRSFKHTVRLSQDPYCWCSITLHSLLKINETRKNTTKRSNIHVESEWCCQLALIHNSQSTDSHCKCRFCPKCWDSYHDVNWRLANWTLLVEHQVPSMAVKQTYRKPFKSYLFLDPLFIVIICYNGL